ncbi:pyridoxamine 5 -phosphate oxidase [Seiridium cupressi]
MSSIKRQRSSDAISGDERDSKLSKVESNAPVAKAILPDAIDRQIRIDIKLGSTRKAAINDPKPTPTREDLLGLLAESGEPTSVAFTRSRGVDVDKARRISSGSASPITPHNCDSAGNPALETREYGRGNDEDEEASEDNDEDNEEDIDPKYDKDDYSDDSSDYEKGHLWLENIYGTATPALSVQPSSRDSKIGFCHARLIRRNRIRKSFWLEMEPHSKETADLAFDLFDRYGRLQSDYYDHTVKKGTGVWGKELNYGDLLLFEEIQINREWRRQGIASKIVNAILEKSKEKTSRSVGFFALVRPRYLTREIEISGGPAEKHLGISRSFWQSLGFRKVGTSSWLAWTESVEHPSRYLELGQNWEEPQEKNEDHVIPHNLEKLYRELTHPVADEKECMGEVRTVLSNDLKCQKWSVLDHHGNTLLHLAALCLKPELVKSILAEAPQAVTLRNSKGWTPAEALQRQLDDQRTGRTGGRAVWVTSDDFTGFGPSAIACVAAFQHFSASDLSTLSPRDIEAAVAATAEQVRRAPAFDIPGIRKTLQLKYGCTCGKCLGGFISPRMKFALVCGAEIRHDLMSDIIEQCTGPDWVEENEHLLTHLPLSVRNNLKTNKSMRQGFTNMFDHFAECLRRGRIPSAREVLFVLDTYKSEWPPVTKNFLQHGGSVASVATMIFETAMEEDEWSGNGQCREVFSEQIEELPSCRNDHEFGFALSQIFDPSSLPITPQEAFEAWLDEAIAQGITEPHAMILSTVDEQGRPDARVLILKDLDERGWHFAAKSTSSKGRQIEKNAEVALTFYWPKLGRQVRIRGSAHPQSEEDCARDFAERPVSSKISAAASKQSDVLSSPDELKEALKSAEALFKEHPEQILPAWKVYAVAPIVVEFWQGATDRMHKRVVYERDEQMLERRKPCIFSCGAFHRASYFDASRQRLEAAGFDVVLVSTHPSLGHDSAGKTMWDDVEALQVQISPYVDEGREFIVIGHSYGGYPALAATQGWTVSERAAVGKKGGVRTVVFFASTVPTAPGMMPMNSQLCHLDAHIRHLFYNDLSPEEADHFEKLLLPHSQEAFETPVNYSVNQAHVAFYYIVAEKYAIILPEVQRQLAASIPGCKALNIDAGHSAFISQADKFVELIGRVADEVSLH